MIPAYIIILLAVSIILFIIIVVLFTVIYSLFVSTSNGSPYIKNDKFVIYEALKLFGLNENSRFIDLGSGEGQALFLASDYFKVKKACGYEIAFWPYFLSLVKKYLRPASKRNSIELKNESLFNADLASYDMIYIYLLPNLIKKLAPQLVEAKKKNPNLRICSTVFEIKNLKPEKISKIYHSVFKKDVFVYLY